MAEQEMLDDVSVLKKETCVEEENLKEENHVDAEREKEQSTILKTLTALAIDLVYTYGLTNATIESEIRKAIIEKAKSLPKIKVLYNDCYGGYGLSKHYVEWIKHKNNEFQKYSDSGRVKAANYIDEYGTYMMNEYPELGYFILIHQNSDIVAMYCVAAELDRNEKSLLTLKKNKEDIEKAIKTTYTKTTILTPKLSDIYSNENVYWSIYTSEQLQTLYDKADFLLKEQELLSKIDTLHNKPMWKDLPETIKHTFRSFEFPVKERHEIKETFMDVFVKDKIEAWAHQNYYDEPVMLLLSESYYNNKELFDFFSTQKKTGKVDELEKVRNIETNVGLLCASRSYARLAIKKVPQNISWDVKEYDGMEHISYA
jgi:hypothetical protein